MCLTLFILLYTILAMVIALIIAYHTIRKQVSEMLPSNFFNTVFIFINFWIITRIIYFTDTFYNYGYDLLIILSTVPNIFTYMTISLAVYNELALC